MFILHEGRLSSLVKLTNLPLCAPTAIEVRNIGYRVFTVDVDEVNYLHGILLNVYLDQPIYLLDRPLIRDFYNYEYPANFVKYDPVLCWPPFECKPTAAWMSLLQGLPPFASQSWFFEYFTRSYYRARVLTPFSGSARLECKQEKANLTVTSFVDSYGFSNNSFPRYLLPVPPTNHVFSSLLSHLG